MSLKQTNLAPEDYIVKVSKWLLCVLVAFAFTAGSVLAAKDGAKPQKDKLAREKKDQTKKGKSALRGEYAIMVSELKLTDEQKTKLIEIVKAKKALAEKTAPIKKEMAEAKKAGNKDKYKELRAKLKELGGDPKAAQAKITAILTDEQKVDWAKFRLYRRACAKFRKAKFTDDQKKAVRDMCAKSGVKATGDKKADAQAFKGLTDKIAAEILTDEQRTAVAPKPKEKKERLEGGKKKPADQ